MTVDEFPVYQKTCSRFSSTIIAEFPILKLRVDDFPMLRKSVDDFPVLKVAEFPMLK